MSFDLVDSGWDHTLFSARAVEPGQLRVVCPFIKRSALERLLGAGDRGSIMVITRFNMADFADGVSDLSALRVLLDYGASVRGIRNLHAKLYLFGSVRAVVTSANLTSAALATNHELGFVADDVDVVDRCRRYFDDLWNRAGEDLTESILTQWDHEITQYLATGAKAETRSKLRDYGVTGQAMAEAPPTAPAPWVTEAPRAYVKLLGSGDRREPSSFGTVDEIQRAGCHWAVAYPRAKRPTGVKDGALIFIGRLTEDPNDIRVFGWAIGMRHEPGRDDATPEDIARRSWKSQWPHYIRVHHAEFVRGSMANGVSLNTLMDTLQAESFSSTQRNLAAGDGNTNPRHAYRQQPAVALSDKGRVWLTQRLETAFTRHGKVVLGDVAGLDWPDVPRSNP